MNELIAIVDENNNVVGSESRKVAQELGLWHRIVVVLVFNSSGQIYIQLRSDKVESSPNMWDHSAAGHVDAKEEPEDAAKRELSEELGIKAERLQKIALYKTQRTENSRRYNRFWYLYSVIYDGEMSFQEEEVKSGKFVEIEWLKEELSSNPNKYTDGLKKSLQTYLESLH